MKPLRIIEVSLPCGRRYTMTEWVLGGQRNEPAAPGTRVTEYGFVRNSDGVMEFMEPVRTWRDDNGYQ